MVDNHGDQDGSDNSEDDSQGDGNHLISFFFGDFAGGFFGFFISFSIVGFDISFREEIILSFSFKSDFFNNKYFERGIYYFVGDV